LSDESLIAVSAGSLNLSKAVKAVFYLNYDGLTDLLEIYEKVCNIDRQLLKAEMKTLKANATVFNILNPEHTPIMSGELQSYPNVQTYASWTDIVSELRYMRTIFLSHEAREQLLTKYNAPGPFLSAIFAQH